MKGTGFKFPQTFVSSLLSVLHSGSSSLNPALSPVIPAARVYTHTADSFTFTWSNESCVGGDVRCKIAQDCVSGTWKRAPSCYLLHIGAAHYPATAEQKQMQSVWKCPPLSHNTVSG